MGVKCTVTLTREEAELKYLKLTGLLNHFSDEELENSLERYNDAANHGEGFENYSIRNHKWED